ncbi:MAG: hypothetical protein V4591_08425 [Bdellovibrionota bacterium]
MSLSNSLFTLKNGTIFVVAEAAGGVYNTTQLKTICEISEQDSSFLKVTEDERLGFMIPQDKIPDVQTKLAAVGVLLRDYRGANFASPKSCLGDLCPKAKQDALGAALEISPLLNEKLKNLQERVSVGINGCSESCVSAATDDIRLVGYENGYKIYIGGNSTEAATVSLFLCEGVPQEKVGEVVLEILNTYSQLKQDNERLCDVLERVGIEAFQKFPQDLDNPLPDSNIELPNLDTEPPDLDTGLTDISTELPNLDTELTDVNTELPDLNTELPSELSMDESGLDGMDLNADGELSHVSYEEPPTDKTSIFDTDEENNAYTDAENKNISLSIIIELKKERIIIENSSGKMNIKISDNDLKKESK